MTRRRSTYQPLAFSMTPAMFLALATGLAILCAELAVAYASIVLSAQ